MDQMIIEILAMANLEKTNLQPPETPVSAN
jgi:hypothetical protein